MYLFGVKMFITKLDVTKLEKAINSFENAIKASEDIEKISEKYIKDTIRAGLIQNLNLHMSLAGNLCNVIWK
jgi:hypothetical protein